MPKARTFPTLYDELKKVSISFLSKYGYLKLNHRQRGIITWSRNGEKTGSVSITVNTNSNSPYLELDYKYNEIPINYSVPLVFSPSNIGKGVVWYFICPRTGRRCRKLYLADNYFFHRLAFKGCLYEKQTYSKPNRKLDRQFSKLFAPDNAYEKIYSKHFKKQYNGKPTKRYLKLLKEID